MCLFENIPISFDMTKHSLYNKIIGFGHDTHFRNLF